MNDSIGTKPSGRARSLSGALSGAVLAASLICAPFSAQGAALSSASSASSAQSFQPFQASQAHFLSPHAAAPASGAGAECDAAWRSRLMAGAECFAGMAAERFLFDTAARYASERGRALFGEQFRIQQRLSYAPQAGGWFSGELDMVLPLSRSAAPDSDDATPRRAGAFFMQQGLSLWTDDYGQRRHDMRIGAVRRFGLAHGRADFVGVSAFFQRNLEHGHARSVLGAEYLGSWGRGTLNLFVPATGWRRVDGPHEERPLGGSELGVELRMTPTLSTTLALGRWEDPNGASAWVTRGRAGLSWHPHDWVNLGVSWDELGTGRDAQSLRLAVAIPLEQVRRPPRWQGLGVAAERAPAHADAWAPVAHVGPIEFARRRIVDAAGLVRDARVEFLDERIVTGELVRLRVKLPAETERAMRVRVRLVPGRGDAPAVAGEDFLEEPMRIVIAQGESQSPVVAVRLPFNETLEEMRMLSATVALIE